MIDLNKWLLNIIYRRDVRFCCLCLNSQNKLINADDDVVLDEAKTLNALDLITCVLGEQYKPDMNCLNWICTKCIGAVISCYNFIQACHETSNKINNTLESLNYFLEKDDNHKHCNPLYIKLNTEGNIVDDYMNNILTEDINLSAIEIDYENVCYKETNIISKKEKSVKSMKAKDLRCKDDQSSYRCKLCLQAYSRGQSLTKHYYRAHAPKKYKCTICTKKYGTLLMLQEHIDGSHITAVCSHCGKVYNSKLSLKTHEKSHIVRHVCQYCGKVYKTTTSYKQHVQSQCGTNKKSIIEEKFTCDHCGKQYTQKSGLRVHIQFAHGSWKSYVCEWCSKKFSSISKWKEHIVTHTKDKKFSCEICGGTFVSKNSLLYHTRTHTGEKPYKCIYCDQSFLSASRRSTHVKCNHMPAIEECDICNKKFKGKSYLRKHRKRHFDPNSRLHSGIE